MRTAEEWRAWYYVTRGRTIEPASLLDDILKDMEELEHNNHFLALSQAMGVELEEKL